MSSALRGRTLAIYVFLCLVWGSTWLVIKIGLRDLPPLSFAGLRMGIACVLLTPFALTSAKIAPTRRQTLLIGWSGFLQIGVSYALVFTASQWIASGLTALLFSSFPIWVGLFGHFLLEDEPLTARAMAAGALGLCGVGTIEGPELTRFLSSASPGPVLTGGVLVLGSAVVSAYANVLNKRSFPEVSPLVNVWGQTLVGSSLLLLLAILFERSAPLRWSGSAVMSLAYLSVFGTALTFAGLFWLIPRVPVSVVGTIPLVDTLIAVLLGNLILREKLSARILLGGLLVLSGVLLAIARARSQPGARASERWH